MKLEGAPIEVLKAAKKMHLQAGNELAGEHPRVRPNRKAWGAVHH